MDPWVLHKEAREFIAVVSLFAPYLINSWSGLAEQVGRMGILVWADFNRPNPGF